ncbi:MAG: PAS domain S-box protein, partial [Elusimicrobiota bacterium]
VKELDCLYAISRLIEKPKINIDEVLQNTVNLIPKSFRKPEDTHVKIQINDKEYKSLSFLETEEKISQNIFAGGSKEGVIEVFSINDKNERPEELFLEEESKLLYDISQLLGLILEKYYFEEVLHKSEERLDYAIKGSGHGIWDWQPQKNEIYLSKRWKEILGYNEFEVENNIDEWFMRIHPDDTNKVMSKLEAQLKGKTQFFEVENRLKTKKGDYKWVLTKGEVVERDEKNQPVRFAGTITDITERKKLEKRLKAKNRSFKMLSEINQLIIRIKTSKKLLEKTCDVLTKTGDYKMAWIGYKDVNKEVLNPVSSSGIENDYLKKLKIDLTDNNMVNEPAAEAFREGHPVVSKDITNDPLFESWNENALEKGYASSIALPLKCKNETFATLNIYSDESDVFDDEELTLLEELADNLSFGLNTLKIRRELDKAREKLKRLNILLNAIRSINQLIVKESNENVLIKKACQLLTKIQRYKTVIIIVLDDSNEVSTWNYSGQDKELKSLIDYFKKGDISCLNKVIDKKKPIIIDDKSLCEKCAMFKECKKHNIVVYPLLSKERIQGLMLISTSRISKFIHEEKDLLEEISGDLGYALNKIEIESKKETYKKKLKETEERFEMFMNNLPAAAFIVDNEGTFYFINKYYKKMLGATDKWIGKNVKDILSEKNSFDLIATNEDALKKGVIEIEETVPDSKGRPRHFNTHKFVLKSRKNIGLIGGIAFDITDHKKMEEALRSSEKKFRTLTESAPIAIMIHQNEKCTYANPATESLTGYSKEELMGISIWDLIHSDSLKIIEEREKLFKAGRSSKTGQEIKINSRDGEIRWIYLVTSSIEFKGKPAVLATAIDITEKKQMEKARRESHDKLIKTFNTMVHTFSKFVEMKDPYTAGHQKKVSELAKKIAERMKLDNERTDAIKTAALLHDMGKIYVPSEILNKPGQLTKLEFEMIKRHPLYGYELLKDIEFDLPLALYIKQHHERLDGSGYPDGLKNGEITLESQILAIADVIEAMTSHRPYRPALEYKEAFDEIRNNAGKLYNEKAVKVCLELFEEGFAFSD